MNIENEVEVKINVKINYSGGRFYQYKKDDVFT